jgi:hypothetical protein
MEHAMLEWTLNRLTELRSEYATGNARLADLARRQDELRVSVLRIEGAIRVLEEQIAQTQPFTAAAQPERAGEPVAEVR